MKLDLINLSKKFGDQKVTDDISIEFEGGKIYGLVGRNGSGKSVLLKLICGFYAPTNGKILLNGVDFSSENSFPENTRALIEKPNFLPDLTGYENLLLLASIQNKIGKDEILDVMIKLNMEQEIDKKFSKYSLGTKQKLGIAQVLMENPDVMIFDEPFNGVEKETAKDVRNLLLEEKKKGKIIIIATHIKDDIDLLADTVYEIEDGKLKKIPLQK